MISNTHAHNQTSVATLNSNNEHSFNGNQGENLANNQEDNFIQHQTAYESRSLDHQLLSQRGYTKGYRGL